MKNAGASLNRIPHFIFSRNIVENNNSNLVKYVLANNF